MINDSLVHEFIENYFNYEINMTYMGHADLGRNNVYLISDKNQVLKTYGDKRRWAAEVASLKFLRNKDFMVPTLVDYGVFQGDFYWLLMNKLEGLSLSEILNQTTPNQYKQVLYDMGHSLAELHRMCKVNQFGEWDENMNKTNNWLTFAEFETEKNRRRGKALLSQHFPENTLFTEGYSKMVSLEDSLLSVSTFTLCHKDFSDRNILVEKAGDDIKIVGIIDFELSYPGDAESDLTQMVLKNYFNKDIQHYLAGYRHNSELSKNFNDKHKYYLISLCLEICSWSRESAYDFYKQAVDVLEQVV